MNLIGAKDVKARCGGVSDMTLWRWLNDPQSDFPQPRYFRKRRYWREDELQEWIERKPQ